MNEMGQKEKIIATKAVVEGSPINLVHKEEGIWILMSKEDREKDAKFDENDLYVIDEEYLYDRIPGLRGRLNQEDKTTINVDFTTGEISINPKHFHFGIPTHGAKGTRQANAGFSYLHYLITVRSLYYKPLIILLVLLVLSKIAGWFFYIPLALYSVFKLLELLKKRDMFYSGDLNPALVIDAKNCKIAVLTNLSRGSGSYPIVRIRKFPLPKKYMVIGEKIPVAGGYQNTKNYDFWNYYEPNPLPTGIKNDQIISDKIKEIPLIEWLELKREIKKFNNIPKEGYYPIKIDSSNWKNVDLNEIKWMQFGEEK